ncbi:MAG: hypothetical protein IKY89_05605 [Alistipes sp.]|nr:hypothetical protein [Alistipes sp.]
MNHTAKLGEVQGPLADALEWMGITTDEFNESLAKCNTEQERQQLIMSTMTGLYGEASAAYKETNADVIAANEANAAWMESMAQVGAVVEPLITEVKTIGAELLSQLVPVIEKIIENLPVVLTLVAGLTAALVAFKITALGGIGAVVTSIQTAFATLWTTMLTNPIGLIIIAVTALVAGFVYLWNNCEGFREFWINLWEKIKAAASSVVDWFKTVPERISSAINGAIERVREWGNKLVEVVKKAATLWLNTMYTIYVKVPSKIWSAISGAITKVTQWGTQMKTKATTAATNMVSAITTKLAQLPGKVMSIGGDLVRGLWNGVNNKLSWLKGKISSFTQSVLGSIKDFFGVHSPARSSGNLKTTDWIGEMLNEGLAVGLLGSTSTPVKAMQKVTGAVLGTAAKANLEGINVGRSLDYNFGQASAPDLISSKLDKILDAIDKGHILVLDGDALVGATVNKYDKALGQRRALAVRGAL